MKIHCWHKSYTLLVETETRTALHVPFDGIKTLKYSQPISLLPHLCNSTIWHLIDVHRWSDTTALPPGAMATGNSPVSPSGTAGRIGLCLGGLCILNQNEVTCASCHRNTGRARTVGENDSMYVNS